MTKTQRVHLDETDIARLKPLADEFGERAVGSLIRLLISEALVARGLSPLTPIRIGYPKGRKRR